MFEVRLQALNGRTFGSEVDKAPFDVAVTDRSVGVFPHCKGNKATSYPVQKLKAICEAYQDGMPLTPDALRANNFYRRKKVPSYLYVIVRALCG